MISVKKRIFVAAAGLTALLIIAALAAVALVDINSYKARIESIASGATGLDVRIRGKMGLSFFPFGASARDIRITGKTGEILSSEELKVGVALLPLLKKEISVSGCRLIGPSLTIEKDPAGKYNFEGPKKPEKKGRGSALSINNITISRGTLTYRDRKTGEKIEMKDLDASISDLSIGDTSGDIISGISFYGKVGCKTARRKALVAGNLRASITAEKGVFSIPFTMDVFGGRGKGEVKMDMSRPVAAYKIDLAVSKLDFARLAEAYSSRKTVGGKGELSASVAMKGKPPLSSMDGTFSLRGDDLIIYSMDIDKVLSKLEGSQEFNLVDLGAFFVAGPLGAAATGGYRLGEVYAQTGSGEGRIRKLVSDWKIKDGVAGAADCAFATKSHRVALKGRLNLAGERYDDVIVALIDDKGCAKFSQHISGPFGSPRIGAVSTAQSLLAPILNLFSKARGMASGGRCEVFYNGSVRP